MRAREYLARRTATALLDELAITSIPVDPESICREKRLLFEERDDFPPSVYGALFRSGNQFGVLVSSACPSPGHRRFTIAHELAHYHMPDHVDRLFSNGVDVVPSLGGHFRSQKDPYEVEADHFASELLMPESALRRVIGTSGSGLIAVRGLADRFGTSLSAAAIRYAAFAGEPTIVIVSKDGSIEWSVRPPVIWAHGWARQPLKKEWAPRGSATRRLAGAPDRIQGLENDDSTTLACEWFQEAPSTLEVIEEALGLGEYGRVLTLLRIPDLPDADEINDPEPSNDDPRDWRDALRGYRMGE